MTMMILLDEREAVTLFFIVLKMILATFNLSFRTGSHLMTNYPSGEFISPNWVPAGAAAFIVILLCGTPSCCLPCSLQQNSDFRRLRRRAAITTPHPPIDCMLHFFCITSNCGEKQ
jgi:hypothetical protein